MRRSPMKKYKPGYYCENCSLGSRRRVGKLLTFDHKVPCIEPHKEHSWRPIPPQVDMVAHHAEVERLVAEGLASSRVAAQIKDLLTQVVAGILIAHPGCEAVLATALDGQREKVTKAKISKEKR